jgi:hypothetical protein
MIAKVGPACRAGPDAMETPTPSKVPSGRRDLLTRRAQNGSGKIKPLRCMFYWSPYDPQGIGVEGIWGGRKPLAALTRVWLFERSKSTHFWNTYLR